MCSNPNYYSARDIDPSLTPCEDGTIIVNAATLAGLQQLTRPLYDAVGLMVQLTAPAVVLTGRDFRLLPPMEMVDLQPQPSPFSHFGRIAYQGRSLPAFLQTFQINGQPVPLIVLTPAQRPFTIHRSQIPGHPDYVPNPHERIKPFEYGFLNPNADAKEALYHLRMMRAAHRAESGVSANQMARFEYLVEIV